MSANQPNANISKKEIKEITIDVPYGKLAAKWWGPRNVCPIICLHGWQDNAGTFDTLIPLLPDHIGYLVIDFPGHGLSTQFPPGMIYGTIDYMFTLHTLVRTYNWPKISILAHSMGAVVAFMYASAFPDQCEMIMCLDFLRVQVVHYTYTSFYLGSFDDLVQADVRNASHTEPNSFTYEEMVNKMAATSPVLDIPRECAPYLLERAIRPSKQHPGKYCFTRDSRLKVFNLVMHSQEMCLEEARRIKCPFLFIKALDAPYIEHKVYFYETLELLERINPNFEVYSVPGGHHVHLVNPTIVSGTISNFINKHRSEINMFSKL